MGQGLGLFGQSYAIPTKDAKIQHTLPLKQIKDHVDIFLELAAAVDPDIQFQVTCIGCGLAGLHHKDIAPMFRDASREAENLFFDTLWKDYLCSQAKFWGTF